jgi:hypothetical protein
MVLEILRGGVTHVVPSFLFGRSFLPHTSENPRELPQRRRWPEFLRYSDSVGTGKALSTQEGAIAQESPSAATVHEAFE